MSNRRKLIVESLGPLGRGGAISFVTAASGDGATTAAVTMAETLAHYMNNKVVLVDGNLTAPFVQSLLRLSPGAGLSDCFLDPSISIEDVIRKGDLPFDVITAGNETDLGLKAMSAQILETLLKTLKSRYSYVLFDLGAFDYSPAASALAPFFDGVVLVINSESTRWEVAQNLRNKLQAGNAKVVGAILNKRRFYIPRFLYRRV